MTLEDHIAIAIAEAFWETADRPRAWGAMNWQERQVFQNCAKRAVEAGKAYREALKSRTPPSERENSREDQQKQPIPKARAA